MLTLIAPKSTPTLDFFCFDFILAFKAELMFTSVNTMLILIVTTIPIRVHIVSDTGPAAFNGI